MVRPGTPNWDVGLQSHYLLVLCACTLSYSYSRSPAKRYIAAPGGGTGHRMGTGRASGCLATSLRSSERRRRGPSSVCTYLLSALLRWALLSIKYTHAGHASLERGGTNAVRRRRSCRVHSSVRITSRWVGMGVLARPPSSRSSRGDVWGLMLTHTSVVGFERGSYLFIPAAGDTRWYVWASFKARHNFRGPKTPCVREIEAHGQVAPKLDRGKTRPRWWLERKELPDYRFLKQ